jgi:hypothetical protein
VVTHTLRRPRLLLQALNGQGRCIVLSDTWRGTEGAAATTHDGRGGRPEPADFMLSAAALSVNDEPATAELIARHGLTFLVGHSADARAIAALTGAFVNPDPGGTCGPPASSSTRPAGSWSAFASAGPSAGSSLRT